MAYTYLVVCKHDENGKAFLFEAPSYIEPNTEVMVETQRGKTHAVVIGSQFAEIGSELYNLFIATLGAKLPLKHVLGKYLYTEFEYKKEA